ncbi:MAG: hypothetical protein LBU23_03485, partial [Planctomycetota bacterium]|nr:hypothetical protein [Planctomycetota bacterium]
MSILAAHAQFQSADRAENARVAAKKLGEELAGVRPSHVVYFAARNYEHAVLARAMRDAFPGAVTFGCSSAGEIVNEQLFRNSVSAMAFSHGTFDFFAAALIPRLTADGKPTDIREAVGAALAGFGKRLGREISSLDYTKYVGLVLADGIKYFIEPVVDRISDLTTIPFIGGLAADDARFLDTPVYLDGRAVNDAALLLLLAPSGKFGLLKTQG